MKKKAMPFWLKIVTAIAILALIIVSIGILFTEGIVEVVDDQLAALKSHDVTKAYYAYTAHQFQSATSLEQFKAFVKTHPELSDIQSTHFRDRSIKDGVSTLKGTLTAANNVKIPIEYQLTKEGGKWKIINIQFQLLTESTVLTTDLKEANEHPD
jgi:hypothetical protein